ncbi:MAG TPA: hypothetical protein VJQ57_13195 [Acidimicrobiia bacterium]|nr:hypothetical protein [Acidimicrobiia bacterium]
MGKKRLLAVLVSTVAILALFAGAAFAGEVTGSGANAEQNQGVSWCSFSGLNDDPGASIDPNVDPNLIPNGPGGQSQSFGQDVRLGFGDPHVFNPGMACNPNHAPDFGFPPQPNRTNTNPVFPKP